MDRLGLLLLCLIGVGCIFLEAPCQSQVLLSVVMVCHISCPNCTFTNCPFNSVPFVCNFNPTISLFTLSLLHHSLLENAVRLNLAVYGTVAADP